MWRKWMLHVGFRILLPKYSWLRSYYWISDSKIVLTTDLLILLSLYWLVWKWKKVKSLSRVWLFATLWTVACQASLSMGIFQARMLQWVAMPSSRETSQSRDGTWVSYISGGFFTIEPPEKLCIYIHLYTCIHTHTHTHCLLYLFICW